MRICKQCGAERLPYQKPCHGCRRDHLRSQPLTALQRSIFDGLLRGLPLKQIQFEVGAGSTKTVHSHKTAIMRKLGAKTNAELILAGVRLGLVPGLAMQPSLPEVPPDPVVGW